ncbi:MAG: TetR/AcrR family transcriptional regulator [Sphingomonadales bacterium]|nr:TetR/AcrR family transcriptional regulator [Sphingomonadales bacterium]
MKLDTDRESPFSRQVQHDRKRQAILSVAARQFNEKGSRATTLLDIAQELNLTKTSLYYYIKTKQELIYLCYLASCEHAKASLDEADRRGHTGLDKILWIQRLMIRSIREVLLGRSAQIAVLSEIPVLKGSHRREITERYWQTLERLKSFLEIGYADGSIAKYDVTLTAYAVFNALQWLIPWLFRQPPEEFDEIERQASEILTHGLFLDRSRPWPKLNLDDLEQPFIATFDRDTQNRLKQEAFFRTGTEFFNKKGFKGTSLDEIAEALHVTKGAFYYHLTNKDDLLWACFDRSLNLVARFQAKAAKEATNGQDKLSRAVGYLFAIQNSSHAPLIRRGLLSAIVDERKQELADRLEEATQRFGGFIREGIEEGSLRPADPTVAQQLIVGAVNGADNLQEDIKTDALSDTAEKYFSFVFHGLSARD